MNLECWIAAEGRAVDPVKLFLVPSVLNPGSSVTERERSNKITEVIIGLIPNGSEAKWHCYSKEKNPD